MSFYYSLCDIAHYALTQMRTSVRYRTGLLFLNHCTYLCTRMLNNVVFRPFFYDRSFIDFPRLEMCSCTIGIIYLIHDLIFVSTDLLFTFGCFEFTGVATEATETEINKGIMDSLILLLFRHF